MVLRALMLATVATVAISAPAMAQAVSEVEGKLVELGEFTDQTTATSHNAKVFGTKIIFNTVPGSPNATAFSTPTRENIPWTTLLSCNNAKIPGFAKKPAGGTMIGGTAIVTGTSNGNGTVTADTAFFEPAENVLLGQITSLPVVNGTTKEVTGSLTIDGTEIVVIGKKRGGQFPPAPKNPTTNASTEIWNPCFPGKGVKNTFFIDIPPENLIDGTEAAAEGWYGDDGKFYAFLIEGVGDALNQPMAIGVLRAQCRFRGGARGMEWEIRGGVGHESTTLGSVTIGRQVPNGKGGVKYEPYGLVPEPVTIDPQDNRYGTFEIDSDLVDNTITECPTSVIVRYQPTNPMVIPADPPTTTEPTIQRFVQVKVGVDAR